MLSIRHVTKRYGNFTALKDITVDFHEGVYGLLAPNGAGKTTLIKMLTTLLFPTKGKILWNGKDIISLGEEYRGLIGYLPQEFGYYKNHSPRQFLQYMGALQGMDRKTAAKRVGEVLPLVGLENESNKKMRSFSGGMLQRVGIAQALIHDPKILILDEPTAGLDPGERVRFRNMIYSLSKDRIVIFSTHIVSDLETIADRILLLRDHRLLCSKSPGELREALQGRIFEIPEEQTEEYSGNIRQEKIQILARRQAEEGSILRIASREAPDDGAKVFPTLEDVYLCIYQPPTGAGCSDWQKLFPNEFFRQDALQQNVPQRSAYTGGTYEP